LSNPHNLTHNAHLHCGTALSRALCTVRNPHSKSLPRAPRIPEPRPVLQLRIWVAWGNASFDENPSFLTALQVSGPRAPLDWFEVRAREHDADAEEEDGEESFQCNVDWEVEFWLRFGGQAESRRGGGGGEEGVLVGAVDAVGGVSWIWVEDLGWEAYACDRKTMPTRLSRLTRNAMVGGVEMFVFLVILGQ
jgi:hypothetical protein